MIKIGTDKGNRGAIIRWGDRLDNGLWIRRWEHRKLWRKTRFMKGYWNFGLFVFAYGR